MDDNVTYANTGTDHGASGVTVTGVAKPEKDARQSRPGNLFMTITSTIWRKYSTFALLAILFGVFTAATPQFLTHRNLSSVLVAQTVAACVSLAAIFPLVVGEFDLSLGYMVGILIILGAFAGEHGAGTVGTIMIVLAGGGLVGLINGVLTVRFKISSFIATLGTGIVLSGITEGLSGGQVLYSGIPHVLLAIGNDSFAGLDIVVWLTLVLSAIVFYVLEFTPFGRRLYAVGGSERVAFLSGIRTARMKIMSFVAAGILVAVAALWQLGTASAADPTFGPALLLPAYAAVFLGVTTFRPGYYNLVGTVVAIVILAIGFNGLSLLGVPYWVQPLFDGSVLLVAVLIARSEARHIQVGS